MKIPLFGRPSAGKDWKSCKDGANVTPEPMRAKKWSPLDFRVKILAAGSLEHTKSLAVTANQVQTQLQQDFKEWLPTTQLNMSVETFLDGCRHSTPWSTKPADITSSATRWHCYPTQTQFVNAFNDMSDSNMPAVEVAILLTDRLDDNPERTAEAAKRLHLEKGTRIFALPLSGETNLSQCLENITSETNGLLLDLGHNPSENIVRNAVREITQCVALKNAGKSLDQLPAPETPLLEHLRKEV